MMYNTNVYIHFISKFIMSDISGLFVESDFICILKVGQNVLFFILYILFFIFILW